MLLRVVSRQFSTRMNATTSAFGIMPNGARVDRVTLASPSGLSVDVITYGATVTSVKVPSQKTGPEEVTLCYSDLNSLREKSPYFGSTCGRVANRIARGRFTLDGADYRLAINNGPNHLHGGLVNWSKVLWSPRIYAEEGAVGVELTYQSHDGEEGYPGNVTAVADYRLTKDNQLCMTFSATADKATPINMCNHAYWNLSGGLKEDIKGHTLQINCSHYLPVGADQIPTGEVAPVAGTGMDFTKPTAVGARILSIDGGGEPGYDHCYARAGPGATAEGMAEIAVLSDPGSGRTMRVSTDLPGVQLYTGNFLSKATGDAPYTQHRALCLETENFPNAINQAGFPSSVLRPGTTYKASSIHTFSW